MSTETYPLPPTPLTPSPTSAQPPVASHHWLPHFARLVRWEMSLLWRRRITAVLTIVIILAYLALQGVILLVYNTAGQATSGPNPVGDILSIPGTLIPAAVFAGNLLPLLVIILAGAYVGGEFGFGTLRLVLIRGTTRLQLVLAQAVVLGIQSLLAVALMGGLALLAGAVFSGLLGLPTAGSANITKEALSFGLSMVLSLWLYALVTLFFAVVGRSVAAGIGFGFGLVFVEAVADRFFPLFLGTPDTTPIHFFAHLPEWLPIENTSLLQAHAGAKPLALTGPDLYYNSVDGTHALLVTLAYCAVAIGLAFFILWRRDVTE